MIEWFQEIFSNPSDKSRAITILFSALVAIIVLLLNQWFTNRRERKKILIEKIEEMYLSSIDYANSANQIIKDLSSAKHRTEQGYYKIDQVVYGEMNDAIRKMNMLCGLYFPEIDFKETDYTIGNLPIVDASIKGKTLEEGEGYHLYEDSRNHIQDAEKKLESICKSLMKNRMV